MQGVESSQTVKPPGKSQTSLAFLQRLNSSVTILRDSCSHITIDHVVNLSPQKEVTQKSPGSSFAEAGSSNE